MREPPFDLTSLHDEVTASLGSYFETEVPEEILALIRLARAARRCHPDTFVSTPDEVAEYIEAAAAFIDSAEANS